MDGSRKGALEKKNCENPKIRPRGLETNVTSSFKFSTTDGTKKNCNDARGRELYLKWEFKNSPVKKTKIYQLKYKPVKEEEKKNTQAPTI